MRPPAPPGTGVPSGASAAVAAAGSGPWWDRSPRQTAEPRYVGSEASRRPLRPRAQMSSGSLMPGLGLWSLGAWQCPPLQT